MGRLVGFDLDSLFQNQQLTQNSFRTIGSIELIESVWVRHGTRTPLHYAAPFWRAFGGGGWKPAKCKHRQIQYTSRDKASVRPSRTHYVTVRLVIRGFCHERTLSRPARVGSGHAFSLHTYTFVDHLTRLQIGTGGRMVLPASCATVASKRLPAACSGHVIEPPVHQQQNSTNRGRRPTASKRLIRTSVGGQRPRRTMGKLYRYV
jgi:hypothetical protein